MAKHDDRVRVLICNLHATSVPWLIVPWLLTLCRLRRVQVVVLQECTPRHARLLKRRTAWVLGGVGAERVLVRKSVDPSHGRTWWMSNGWMGHHTRTMHPDRTLPSILVAGWLRVGSVHLPPAWEHGPDDRQAAGAEYLDSLQAELDELDELDELEDVALVLAGDWNARRLAKALILFRNRCGLSARGFTLDHVAFRGCRVTTFKRLGMGPGQDHHNWLLVVERIR